MESRRNPANSSAAALLAYDVGHRRPWDWRVSLYTLTKGISAGAYLVAALLVLFGVLPAESALFRWAAPLLSLVALAVTGALLIWDLEHPERFYFLFTRPQWKSWLVKGAVILAAYGLLLTVHLLAAWAGASGPLRALLWPGVALAAMAAIYTAYLLAQAKARDLWQSPLLPAQLLIQAGLAGCAALLLLALAVEPAALPGLLWVLATTSAVHLLLVWGETTLPHVTAHAHLACREMTRGDFARFFWTGIALGLAGIVAPLGGSLAPILAAAALLGLFAYEHAYIQAGQSVPLA